MSASVLICLMCLLSLSVLPKACAAETPPTDPLHDALKQQVQAYHDRGEFDGVVVIAQRDTILFAGGFGAADREHNLPNTPDTPFRICSLTKQFTAVLVMQQVEQGKLSLDRPITDYLPDFRRDTGSKITVKHLLSHTSGLPNFDTILPMVGEVPGIYYRTEPQYADPAYLIKTYFSGDLSAVPGEQFAYNNADYIVLQAILERVTGKSYTKLLQDRILKPLGMSHTGVITRSPFAKKQAIGYRKEGDSLTREPDYQIANFGAAGAMYSTANDLLRWNRALDSDRLLTPRYRDIMFTPFPAGGYGAMGSWVFPFAAKGITKSPRLIDREGEIGAFKLSNIRVLEDGISVLVLSNTETSQLGAAYMGKGLVFDLLKQLYTVSPSPKP